MERKDEGSPESPRGSAVAVAIPLLLMVVLVIGILIAMVGCKKEQTSTTTGPAVVSAAGGHLSIAIQGTKSWERGWGSCSRSSASGGGGFRWQNRVSPRKAQCCGNCSET